MRTVSIHTKTEITVLNPPFSGAATLGSPLSFQCLYSIWTVDSRTLWPWALSFPVVWLAHLLFWAPIITSHFLLGCLDLSSQLWALFLEGGNLLTWANHQFPNGGSSSDLLEVLLHTVQSLPLFVHGFAISFAATGAYFYTAHSQARGHDMNYTCRFDIFDFAGGYVTRILSHTVHFWVAFVLYGALDIPALWKSARLGIAATLGYATSTAFGFTFMNVIDYARAAGEDWRNNPSVWSRCKSLSLLVFAVTGGWLSFAQITDWITDRHWWFSTDTLLLFGGYAAIFFHYGLILRQLRNHPIMRSTASKKRDAAGSSATEEAGRRGDGGTWDFKHVNDRRSRRGTGKLGISRDGKGAAGRDRSSSSQIQLHGVAALQQPLDNAQWPVLCFKLGWQSLEDVDRGVWDVGRRLSELKDKLDEMRNKRVWRSLNWGMWQVHWMGLGRMYSPSCVALRNLMAEQYCSTRGSEKIAQWEDDSMRWGGMWVPCGVLSGQEAVTLGKSVDAEGAFGNTRPSNWLGTLLTLLKLRQPKAASDSATSTSTYNSALIADVPVLAALGTPSSEGEGLRSPVSIQDTPKRGRAHSSSVQALDVPKPSSGGSTWQDRMMNLLAEPGADFSGHDNDASNTSNDSAQREGSGYDYHPYTQPWLTHEREKALRPLVISAESVEGTLFLVCVTAKHALEDAVLCFFPRSESVGLQSQPFAQTRMAPKLSHRGRCGRPLSLHFHPSASAFPRVDQCND